MLSLTPTPRTDMSIESRAAYRFTFLRSEQWQTLRLMCIATDGGKCVLCGKLDVSNDAHHLFYRPNWKDTKLDDLLTLCRKCHRTVHELGADILAPKLWTKFAYLFRKQKDSCPLCLIVPVSPLVQLCWDGPKQQDGSKKQFTPKVCQSCAEQFRSARQQNPNPWKAYKSVREANQPKGLRQFRIETLKECVVFGMQKAGDRKRFNRAIEVVAPLLRSVYSVDKSA